MKCIIQLFNPPLTRFLKSVCTNVYGHADERLEFPTSCACFMVKAFVLTIQSLQTQPLNSSKWVSTKAVSETNTALSPVLGKKVHVCSMMIFVWFIFCCVLNGYNYRLGFVLTSDCDTRFCK